MLFFVSESGKLIYLQKMLNWILVKRKVRVTKKFVTGNGSAADNMPLCYNSAREYQSEVSLFHLPAV